MGTIDNIRALTAYANSGIPVIDKITEIALAIIAEHAAKGLTQVLLIPAELDNYGENNVSVDDMRHLARVFKGEGFDVHKSTIQGSFWVSWGDSIDEWWDSAL